MYLRAEHREHPRFSHVYTKFPDNPLAVGGAWMDYGERFEKGKKAAKESKGKKVVKNQDKGEEEEDSEAEEKPKKESPSWAILTYRKLGNRHMYPILPERPGTATLTASKNIIRQFVGDVYSEFHPT